MKRLPNIHPGEVLLEDYLKPLGLSQDADGARHAQRDGGYDDSA